MTVEKKGLSKLDFLKNEMKSDGWVFVEQLGDVNDFNKLSNSEVIMNESTGKSFVQYWQQNRITKQKKYIQDVYIYKTALMIYKPGESYVLVYSKKRNEPTGHP